MNRTFSLCLLACAPFVLAQELDQDRDEDAADDPVISALTEGDDELPVAGAGAEGGKPGDEPVLFKGKPPENAEIEEAPPAFPEPEGVTVAVEPGRGGSGAIDPSAVKLLAPFPSKPIFPAPTGWKLDHPESVPAFTREVKLANGTPLSLSVRPHVLVPDADGSEVVGVQEPGYDARLAHAQTRTMASIISRSVDRMEEDSLALGEAMDRLSQLLSSLPDHEPEPEPEPATKPAPAKKNR